MRWAHVGVVLLNLLMIAGFVMYWFNPGGQAEFFETERNPSFSLNNNSVQMQFYENMRFPEKEISYKIDSTCNLNKQKDMTEAFNIVSNYTILEFYPVANSEEITITCQEKKVLEEGLFIAGEGGPTNITDGDVFKVIFDGSILLIKDSDCERPNVAIHELLHVLGFNHSDNANNIMYPVSKCRQEIGDEIINEINRLYSIDSLPDLSLDSAEAQVNGRNLALNISIKNEGLKDSKNSILKLYTDEKLVKEIEIEQIQIGHGLKIELQNLWLSKLNFEELKILIESSETELSDDNNKIVLSKI